MKRAKQDEEKINLRISPALRNAVLDAARRLDLDLSKFARQAMREKLTTLGVKVTDN